MYMRGFVVSRWWLGIPISFRVVQRRHFQQFAGGIEGIEVVLVEHPGVTENVESLSIRAIKQPSAGRIGAAGVNTLNAQMIDQIRGRQRRSVVAILLFRRKQVTEDERRL